MLISSLAFTFFWFFPLTQVFSVPFIWGLVLQTHFVWSSSLGEQQRQEASRWGRISVRGALSCELLSAHSQTAALLGQNPCEYWHQAYNYPQVLLSRNHLLVAFYKALQHRYSEKLLVCWETLSSHKVLLSAPSMQTPVCSVTPHCKLQLLCLHFAPKRDDVLAAKLKCIKYATSIFPCWQLQ